MSDYNAKNYTEQGGTVTHIGGKMIFEDGSSVEGLPSSVAPAENQVGSSASTLSELKRDFNGLLVRLKNAGLMEPNKFTMEYYDVTDTVEENADRQANTDKILNVTVDNTTHEITIALSEKVEDLEDFDGGNDWGVHKWLGVGLCVGVSPITGLKYNGSYLTLDDATEASQCSLDPGYFVRWVAADLVLAGDNTQKSKDYFTLWADGYEETIYTLKIVEFAA